MTISKYEGRTGGKFCKWPLRRIPSTPYDRPPSVTRGNCPPSLVNEAGWSGWFSKIVDPAVRVIVGSVSRLVSSVFGKGLAATPGQNISTIDEVPTMISSPEVKEQGGNSIDIRLSIHYDGSDASKKEILSFIDDIFQFEKLPNRKRFSRVEIDHLHSRNIEPSTLPLAFYKNEEKISKDSNINPSSSHQVLKLEKEKGVNVTIREKDFESPIEIAKAYLGSKPRKPTPSIVGMQAKICHKDKALFAKKLVNTSIASKSASCFPVDSQNIYKTPKLRGKSTLYKWARSPYFRSSVMTNSKEYSPHEGTKVEPKRTIKWATLPSNIRHFGCGQALKRDSSDRDAGCSSDARRVRQKTSLNDLNWLTRANTSSFFLGQEQRQSINLKGVNNPDDKTYLASFHNAAPPHSVEIGRKILQTNLVNI